MEEDKVLNLAKKIAEKINYPIDRLDSLESFLEAIDNHLSKKAEYDFIEILKNLGFGSKAFEEPTRFYLLLRVLENWRYQQGFEDGVRVTKKSMSDEETKKLREMQIEILKSILDTYKNHIVPVLQTLMATFSKMSQRQDQLKIEFE